MNQKKCCVCQQFKEKTPQNFYFFKDKRDGRMYAQSRCKSCESDYKAKKKMAPLTDQPDTEQLTTTEENGVYEIKYHWENLKTKAEFLAHINFDPSISEETFYQCNVREVLLRTGKNESMLVKKYDHLFKTKPRTTPWLSQADLEQILVDTCKRVAVKRPLKQRNQQINSLMMEFGLYDFHLNKYCSESETWQRRDLETAERVWHEATMQCITYALAHNLEQIVYVVGNDFFHVDWMNNATTAWTRQDVSGMRKEAYKLWLKLQKQTIDALSDIAPVKVIVVPWNHDSQLTRTLGIALNAIYCMDDNVEVDAWDSVRKYYKWWDNMFIYAHWDREKPEKLLPLAATEQPMMRATSKYRTARLWHYHSGKQIDVYWLDVEYMRSMTATDSWHAANGYIGNIRSGKAVLWKKEWGKYTEFYIYNQ